MSEVRENNQKEISMEEANQVVRSTKKVKTSEISNEGEEIWGSAEVGIEETRETDGKRKGSYRDKLMGMDAVSLDLDLDIEGSSNYSMEESDSDEEEGEPDCPTIRLTREDKARMRRPWQKAVIIKLLGKIIGFKFLERKLYQLWEINSPITITDLGNEFYVIKFSNGDEYDKALFGGPWIVADHYLSVRQWTPEFDPENASIDSLAVWIRLPNLPIEYYDRVFLTRLGNRLGRTVKVDETTIEASRGKFARVCVDIDLNKPLISKYRLRRKVRRIEYEAIPLVCFECGIYGNIMEECPKLAIEKEKEEDVIEKGGGAEDIHEQPVEIRLEVVENFGPWMLAQKKSRARSSKDKGKAGNSGDKKGNIQGFRFEVLAEEETDGIELDNAGEKRVVLQEVGNIVNQQDRTTKTGRGKKSRAGGGETVLNNEMEQKAVLGRVNGEDNSGKLGGCTLTKGLNRSPNVDPEESSLGQATIRDNRHNANPCRNSTTYQT